MRFASSSLVFGITALVVLLHTQKTNADVKQRKHRENCPSENCLPVEQCEEVVSSASCMIAGSVCCSIVKNEFRTACRHHGGECMDKCSLSLAHNTTDCSNNQMCCVLV